VRQKEPAETDHIGRDLLEGGLLDAPGAVENAAALGRDLLVGGAQDPQLVLILPRSPEGGVGVRIHEAGQYHRRPVAKIDDLELPRINISHNGGGGTDGLDPAVADEDRTRLDETELPHLRPAAGAGRPGHGQDLTDVNQGQRFGCHRVRACSIYSSIRSNSRRPRTSCFSTKAAVSSRNWR